MSMFNRNIASVLSPERMARSLLADCGYDLIDMELIGQDPDMYGVEYVVLGANPYSASPQNQYATWILTDWTRHPTKQRRTATLTRGDYQIPNYEARRQYQMRIQKERRNFTWVLPGTDFVLYR